MRSAQDFSAVAVIPAHLASARFPRKILVHIHGLPMIEHVRRRALLSNYLERVIVATCDEEIASVIRGFGGDVIMTANTHLNGTTRIAEAIENVDCSHVVLLQGDEPLLLPSHVDKLVSSMASDISSVAWNATGPIVKYDELDLHSFVKCSIAPNDNIMYCFRRSPSFSSYENQIQYTRKILGIIGYRKEFLLSLTQLYSSPVELCESIEQLRILENGYPLRSVPVAPSLSSVNEPCDLDSVLHYLTHDPEQHRLLESILSTNV
jgi:3-deoxy-manno-octulosonate cytidylyltransferase (CMP-KDO synthetase)